MGGPIASYIVFCVPIFVCLQCLRRKPCYLPGSGHFLTAQSAADHLSHEGNGQYVQVCLGHADVAPCPTRVRNMIGVHDFGFSNSDVASVLVRHTGIRVQIV
jgi:hypothetical protein